MLGSWVRDQKLLTELLSKELHCFPEQEAAEEGNQNEATTTWCRIPVGRALPPRALGVFTTLMVLRTYCPNCSEPFLTGCHYVSLSVLELMMSTSLAQTCRDPSAPPLPLPPEC